MMTARHLVRRLLALRSSSSEPIQFGANVGHCDTRQAQTANDAEFRPGVAILHGNSQTEVNNAVGDTQLGIEVSGFWVPFKRKPTPQQGEAA